MLVVALSVVPDCDVVVAVVLELSVTEVPEVFVVEFVTGVVIAVVEATVPDSTFVVVVEFFVVVVLLLVVVVVLFLVVVRFLVVFLLVVVLRVVVSVVVSDVSLSLVDSNTHVVIG